MIIPGTPVRTAVQQLLAAGLGNLNVGEPAELLSHADQRIRLNAQVELVKLDETNILCNVANNVKAAQLGRIHAMWGLGQLNAAIKKSDNFHATESQLTLVALLRDSDVEIQCQAARLLADARSVDGGPFVALLSSGSHRVRFMAMMALPDHPHASAFEMLTSIAASIEPAESYLRHAVCNTLASCGTAVQLGELSRSSVSMLRLCAVVALRHQKAAEASEFLHDGDHAVAEEAARAIHDDFSIVDALPKLAAALMGGPKSEVFLRRAINANYRLGGAGEFRRLVEFACSEIEPVMLRLEALDALASWESPVRLDRVTGRHRIYGDRLKDTSLEQTSTALALLLNHTDADIQAAAMKVHRELKLRVDDVKLSNLATCATAASTLVVEALNLLDAQNSNRLPQTLATTIGSSDNDVRV